MLLYVRISSACLEFKYCKTFELLSGSAQNGLFTIRYAFRFVYYNVYFIELNLKLKNHLHVICEQKRIVSLVFVSFKIKAA
jgi:hypothetical protein